MNEQIWLASVGDAMRHACSSGLVAAVVVMGLMSSPAATAAEAPAGEIRINLTADGEHCVVRDATIRCSDLAAYLRDTLKLPPETIVHLQAARAAPDQSVRRVLDVIAKSGFNHPVAYISEPKSSASK